MGIFDDLIPQDTATKPKGMFDDLIPAAPKVKTSKEFPWSADNPPPANRRQNFNNTKTPLRVIEGIGSDMRDPKRKAELDAMFGTIEERRAKKPKGMFDDLIPAKPAETDEIDAGEFTNAFMRSAGPQNLELTGQTMLAFEDLTDDTTFSQSAKDMIKTGRKWKEGVAGPSVPSLDKIHIMQEGGLSRMGDYIAQAAGQGLGSSVLPLAGGFTGGYIGSRIAGKPGGVAGSLAGAFTASNALNIGSMRQTLLEEGLNGMTASEFDGAPNTPKEKAWKAEQKKLRGKVAIVGGVAMSALDSLLPGEIASKFTGAARKEVEKSIARAIIDATVHGGFKEGWTEGAQQAIQDVLGKYATGNDIDLKKLAWDVLENTVQGSIGGAIMGGGAETVKQVMPGKEPPPPPGSERIEPRLASPPASPSGQASGLPPVNLPPTTPGYTGPTEAAQPAPAVPAVGQAPMAPKEIRRPVDSPKAQERVSVTFDDLIPAKPETEAPRPTEGVSFIITKAQKQEMARRGYTVDQIKNMAPAEAHALLREPAPLTFEDGIPAKPEGETVDVFGVKVPKKVYEQAGRERNQPAAPPAPVEAAPEAPAAELQKTDLPAGQENEVGTRQAPVKAETAEPSKPLPAETLGSEYREFAPSELKVDAKRFQFKEGANDAGVTDRLKGVKEWDQTKAGITLVWQNKQGENFVADGRQRHALASRLESEGQKPRMLSVTLREADGITPEKARAIAAAKNIAEGTGTTIDAAKILRDTPNVALSLPPNSSLVRDAKGLAKLSPDGFGMVVNKKVQPAHAAIVGQLAPDPKTHADLLGLLAKNEPDNVTEAESMVRDALEAPSVQSTMEDMFGSAETTQILFKERAQILSASATAIRKDRAAFSTLVKEEGRIAKAGNKLVTDKNAERATQDAELLATLQATARRKGPIADALATAAKQLHEGQPVKTVIGNFLDVLRSGNQDTGESGRGAGGTGRQDEASGEPRLAPPPAPREEASPREASAPKSEPEVKANTPVADRPVADQKPEPAPAEDSVAAITKAIKDGFEAAFTVLIAAEAKPEKPELIKNPEPDATSETPPEKGSEAKGEKGTLASRAMTSGFFTGPSRAELAELQAKIDTLADRILGHRITVKLTSVIRDREGKDTGMLAAFDPNTMSIEIALSHAHDFIESFGHESLHALRDLGVFTKDEWNLLKGEAKRGTVDGRPIMEEIRERYDAMYRKSMDLTEAQHQDLLEEEAVAFMMGAHVAGKIELRSGVARLIDKIHQFLEAILNAAKGYGFRTGRGVIADIQSGKMKERPTSEGEGRGYGLKRRNNAPSAQEGQTETPAFKAWFKNSQVVNPDGTPRVVYHGSERSGFEAFDESYRNKGRRTIGHYFTTSPTGAATYSGTKNEAVVSEKREDFDPRFDGKPGNYPVYLSMQNPMIVDFDGRDWTGRGPNDSDHDSMDTIAEDAKEEGHDGVIAYNVVDEGRYGQGYGWDQVTYIVFEPTQIKSIRNKGAFDPADDRILFNKGKDEGDSLLGWQSPEVKAKAQKFAAALAAATEQANAPGITPDEQQAIGKAFRDKYFTEPGAEGLPQTVIPGAERISEGERLQRLADAKLKAKVGQKLEMDMGLFGDEKNQGELFNAPRRNTATPEFRKWFSGSKVVDDAGKPKAVFHGSRVPYIERFDLAMEGTGAVNTSSTKLGGVWFTSSRDNAEFFADARENTEADPDSVYLYGEGKENLAAIDDVDGNALFQVGPYATPDAAREAGLQAVERYNKDEGRGNGIVEAYLAIKNPFVIEGRPPREKEFAEAKTKGHDGIIATDVVDGAFPSDVFVAFSPTQIKSVHNRGTFSPDDANILFSAPPTGTPDPSDMGKDEESKEKLRKISDSINLRYVLGEDDIKQMLWDIAERAKHFVEARRGVQTHAMTAQLAKEMGLTENQLLNRKVGETYNAAGIFAARVMMMKSLKRLASMSAQTKQSRSLADAAEFLKVYTRHVAIQEVVAGLRTEAARATEQFKMMAGDTYFQAAEAILDAARSKNKDRPLGAKNKLGIDAALDLAEMIDALNDPAQINKFTREAFKVTIFDMIREYWINALLSSPSTHATNILSNTITALWQVPETAVASAIGLLHGGEKVRVMETMARLEGLLEGTKDGLIAGWATLKTGEPTDLASKLENHRKKAIPTVIGSIIRTPGTMLMAEDEIFKAMNYRAELHALATRHAMKQGLKGVSLSARIAELLQNPRASMKKAAHEAAVYNTFQTKLGPIGSYVMGLREKIPGAYLIAPFIRTPANLIKYAAERTPLGLAMGSVRDNLSGKNGNVARDTQISRMALGSAIAAVVASYVMAGMISGSGPDDPDERNVLRAAGWQPYSVNIGGTWYSYQRFDPFAMIVGITADMVELGEAVSEADAGKIGAMIISSISGNLLDKTWLNGPSDFIAAIQEPKRYGDQYVRRFAGSFVPALFSKVNQTYFDPVLRDARSMLDTIKSRLPYYSQALPPRRNIFGEEIVREGALGPDILSTVFMSTDKENPIAKEMVRLNYFPSMPRREINGNPLTPEQYDQYTEIAGKQAVKLLERKVALPAWQRRQPDDNIKIIKDAYDKAREQARNQMKRQYPKLRKKPK